MSGGRPRLALVWGLLGLLLALIVATERADLLGAGRERARPEPRRLVPLAAERLGAVEVAEAGRRHRFERDPGGAWIYHGAHSGGEGAHAHAVDPAAAARIEQSLGAFARARIERELGRVPDPGAYGVASPRVVILLYAPGASQPVVQYAVGDLAPDGLSRYVDVVGGPGIVTIPDYQVEQLLRLVATLAAGPRPGGAGPVPAARR